MNDKVKDISGLITALTLTKSYPFVYLLLFIYNYCSLKAETVMHMTY